MDRMRVASRLLCPNPGPNARSFERRVEAHTQDPRHSRHDFRVGVLSGDHRFCFCGTDLPSKELLDLVISQQQELPAEHRGQPRVAQSQEELPPQGRAATTART